MGESRVRLIAYVVGVLVLAVVAFVIWRGMGVPAPTIPAGQTLQNPYGSQGPPAMQQGRQQIPQGGRGMPSNVPPGIPPGNDARGPATQQPGGTR